MQQRGLTVTAPAGALCGLYPGAPATLIYSTAIDPKNAIPPEQVTTQQGITSYYYPQLEPGTYHCGASMEGYNSLCQVLWYTAEKARTGVQLDMQLQKLAGNGYEAGYVMRHSQEYIDALMASQSDSWGEEYAGLFRTPQFQPGRPGPHQQTTNEELMAFIQKLDSQTAHMHVFILDKSPKYGYPIPLVLFTRENITGMTLEQAAEIIRGNQKPTVGYHAQCHSSEPAASEGALAMMLQLCGDYGEKVLEHLDIYIIPRINVDGAYESVRFSPTTGEDMNRDYMRMNNREICTVTGAFNLFLPEVVIDGHEKSPTLRSAGDSVCTDMEVQVGAGSLNHDAAMTELAMEMVLEAMGNGRDLGLRTHFYGRLASAHGGTAGSSYYGVRNSLSFLVETPGQIHLGMSFMERRVIAHYILASSLIDYTIAHKEKVMATVRTSREQMARSGAIYNGSLIVLAHQATEAGRWASPLIHVPSGEVVDPDYAEAYTEHTAALRTRTRPTAYLLPKGLAAEKEILRVAKGHAIPWYSLEPGSAVSVRQYLQDGKETSLTEETEVSFETGAWVFPNTVPSTVLAVLMEPDFEIDSGRKYSLYSMALISADSQKRLPLYRYCHDLRDGKIQ